MKNKPTVVVCIEDRQCVLDRQALLDLMIVISERHGRVCGKIASCGDMRLATELAEVLEGLNDTHAVMQEALEALEIPGPEEVLP